MFFFSSIISPERETIAALARETPRFGHPGVASWQLPRPFAAGFFVDLARYLRDFSFAKGLDGPLRRFRLIWAWSQDP